MKRMISDEGSILLKIYKDNIKYNFLPLDFSEYIYCYFVGVALYQNLAGNVWNSPLYTTVISNSGIHKNKKGRQYLPFSMIVAVPLVLYKSCMTDVPCLVLYFYEVNSRS